MDQAPPLVVAQGPLGRMRELQELLSKREIPAEVLPQPGSSGGG